MSSPIDPDDVPMQPSNVPAAISAVFGVLFCVPATGLIAIPLGLLGLRKAKQIGGVGTRPAQVGLVLGIVNIAWWLALFAGAYGMLRTYKLSQPSIEATNTFIRAVGSGNINDAKSLCTDAIDEDRLTDTCEQIRKWGALEKVDNLWGGKYHGPSDIEVTAEMKFETVTKYITTHWTTTEKGPQLTAYEFRDPPATQEIDPTATQPTTKA